MPRIVAAGMSNTDLVCRTPRLPVAGETVAGISFSTFAGGKGANQAVAAARAGATVWFCGATGDDAYGRARRNDLASGGIDVEHLQELEGVPSGIALIVVDDTGENQIVTIAGANGEVDADRASRAIARLSIDLALMTWELAPETTVQIIAAISSDVPVVLNIAPFHKTVRDVLPDQRLIVVCNEIEAGQLLRQPVDGDNALDAATSILELGCRAVVITLGASGAVGAAPGETWTVRPPAVDVLDTTGAGDSFCGAFAAWLAGGASLVEATEAGVFAGAIATTVHGAQPSIPTHEQIQLSLETGAVANEPAGSR